MDKNTIIGILLIGAIFIGFSYFNNTRLNKAFQKEIETADSLYNAEDYRNAKGSYMKALQIRPKQPYPALKISEIDSLLAITQSQTDTVQQAEVAEPAMVQPVPTPGKVQDSLPPGDQESLDGIFDQASLVEQEMITLELPNQLPCDWSRNPVNT